MFLVRLTFELMDSVKQMGIIRQASLWVKGWIREKAEECTLPAKLGHQSSFVLRLRTLDSLLHSAWLTSLLSLFVDSRLWYFLPWIIVWAHLWFVVLLHNTWLTHKEERARVVWWEGKQKTWEKKPDTPTLWFWIPASKTVRKHIFLVSAIWTLVFSYSTPVLFVDLSCCNKYHYQN